MLNELVSRNEDLKRLLDKGYALGLDSSFLVVRDIPYLDKDKNLRGGAFVTKLVFVDNDRVQQENHQVFFCGSHPHNIDGTPIANLGPTETRLTLEDPDLVVERSFSNKPVGSNGFVDFFEKIESYACIITAPAVALHRGATPLTFRADKSMTAGSIFKFHDTLTSRAEIGDLAKLLREEVIAIIGLGGTGAYILDFMVKSPVKEIRGFDGDAFHVHSAFRSPGRLLNEGELGTKKASVYLQRYTNFRHGLRLESKYIDASCDSELDGVSFAFVAVDRGPARSEIFDLLIAKKVPFIDVGMGLERERGSLGGMARMTYYPADRAEDVRAKNFAEMVDAPDDEYRVTIQISELNALNAALAVIRYKQIRGIYVDDGSPLHALFDVNDLAIAGKQFE